MSDDPSYKPYTKPPLTVPTKGLLGDFDGDTFMIPSPPTPTYKPYKGDIDGALPPDSEIKKKVTSNPNFKVLETSRRIKGEFYKLIEHQVTGERKWVYSSQISSKGMSNAFYDADPQFVPPTTDDDDFDISF